MNAATRKPVYHGCGAIVFTVPSSVVEGERILASHIEFPDGRRPKALDVIEGCPRCGMAVTFGATLRSPDA